MGQKAPGGKVIHISIDDANSIRGIVNVSGKLIFHKLEKTDRTLATDLSAIPATNLLFKTQSDVKDILHLPYVVKALNRRFSTE